MERVKAELRKGNTQMARQRLTEVEALRQQPELASFVSDDALAALDEMIGTMPRAAEQVLKNSTSSPFSALGIERQHQARILNTVNKRALLKNYRKLALRLHPDKCEHEVNSMRLPYRHTCTHAHAHAGMHPSLDRSPLLDLPASCSADGLDRHASAQRSL